MSTAKKNIAALSLAILLSVQNVSAVSYVPSCNTVKDAAKTALVCAIFYSAYEFYSRKPTNDPAAYNLDELLALNNVSENLKGLWFDGFWGHTGKSTSLKVDENGNVVADVTKVNPKGLMGNIVHNAKSIAAALGTTLAIKIILEALADQSDASFETKVINKIDAVAKKCGFKLLPQTVHMIEEIKK